MERDESKSGRNDGELAARIYQHLDCTEGMVTRDFIALVLNQIKTFDEKQHDYGSMNIAIRGESGVLTRVSDKVQRLIHLEESKATAKNESIEDSWLDISVYGTIALMIRRGLWPETKEWKRKQENEV